MSQADNAKLTARTNFEYLSGTSRLAFQKLSSLLFWPLDFCMECFVNNPRHDAYMKYSYIHAYMKYTCLYEICIYGICIYACIYGICIYTWYMEYAYIHEYVKFWHALHCLIGIISNWGRDSTSHWSIFPLGLINMKFLHAAEGYGKND